MEKQFKIGDRIDRNSEAGTVSDKTINVHSKDVDYKGHAPHPSVGEPQSKIKSDKTDDVAIHKGSALKKLGTK